MSCGGNQSGCPPPPENAVCSMVQGESCPCDEDNNDDCCGNKKPGGKNPCPSSTNTCSGPQKSVSQVREKCPAPPPPPPEKPACPAEEAERCPCDEDNNDDCCGNKKPGGKNPCPTGSNTCSGPQKSSSQLRGTPSNQNGASPRGCSCGPVEPKVQGCQNSNHQQRQSSQQGPHQCSNKGSRASGGNMPRRNSQRRSSSKKRQAMGSPSGQRITSQQQMMPNNMNCPDMEPPSPPPPPPEKPKQIVAACCYADKSLLPVADIHGSDSKPTQCDCGTDSKPTSAEEYSCSTCAEFEFRQEDECPKPPACEPKPPC